MFSFSWGAPRPSNKSRALIPIPSKNERASCQEGADIERLSYRDQPTQHTEEQLTSEGDDSALFNLTSQVQSLENELQTETRQRIAAEEKSRRQAEIHDRDTVQYLEQIKLLQWDNGTLSDQIKTKLEIDLVDDATFEALTLDIFHLLRTWCFSNFKNTQNSVCRSSIQSDICAVLTHDILSPLVIGLPPVILEFLVRLDWDLLTSESKIHEYEWRLLTIRTASRLSGNFSALDTYYAYLEQSFSHRADSTKCVSRQRCLRRMLEKAINLHHQLNQQKEKYLVDWIDQGTPFSAQTMQIHSKEVAEGSGRVVQYCHQPLLRKLTRNGLDTTVIVRAIVICEE